MGTLVVVVVAAAVLGFFPTTINLMNILTILKSNIGTCLRLSVMQTLAEWRNIWSKSPVYSQTITRFIIAFCGVEEWQVGGVMFSFTSDLGYLNLNPLPHHTGLDLLMENSDIAETSLCRLSSHLRMHIKRRNMYWPMICTPHISLMVVVTIIVLFEIK